MKSMFQALALLIVTSSPLCAGPSVGDVLEQITLFTSSAPGSFEECVSPPPIFTDVRLLPPVSGNRPDSHAVAAHRVGAHDALVGAATMRYGFEVVVDTGMMRIGRSYCVHLERLDIRAGHTPPSIWMDPAHSGDACRRAVTLQHELEHVANFHEHLLRFEAAVHRNLRTALNKRSGQLIGTVDDAIAARHELKSLVKDVVRELHEESYAIALEKDRAMDTPAEYARLAQLCM